MLQCKVDKVNLYTGCKNLSKMYLVMSIHVPLPKNRIMQLENMHKNTCKLF